MNHTFKQTFSEIGFALVLTFIPLGMFGKVFLGYSFLGSLFMIMGILLLFPFRNFFLKKRRGIWRKNNICFMAFYALSFLYYFLSDADYKEALYLGVPLTTSIALTYTRYEIDIKINRVIMYTWALSFICVIAGWVFVSSGMYAMMVYWDEAERKMYDDLTMGGICGINIYCSLFLMQKCQSQYLRVLLMICILADLILILETGKRTPLIVAVVSIILWNRLIGESFVFRAGHLLIGILSFCIVILFVDPESILSKIDRSYESIVNGIHDLIYGAVNDGTNSTAMRYAARQAAWKDLSEFALYEYVFGKGYMYKWLDMPLLQAYMDMGILGLLLFFMNRIWLPLKVFWKRPKNVRLLWALLFSSYGVLGCLTTGTPYAHGHWTALACFIFILNGERTFHEENQPKGN